MGCHISECEHATAIAQPRRLRPLALVVAAISACAGLQSATPAFATLSDGIAELQALNPALNGSGVSVGQVEANIDTNTNGPDQFEVNPAASGVNQPQRVFSYIDGSGNVTTAFSSAGYSGHATTVAQYFYGTAGAARGVANVDNYDAGYFQNQVIDNAVSNGSGGYSLPATLHSDSVINQSFINTFPTTASASYIATQVQYINAIYDAYTNTYGTIFVSAIGNGQTVKTSPTSEINPPATAYNSIAVGAYNLSTGTVVSSGPTYDGRSKPDLVAPGSETSYATPIVSGIAAVMVQAGNLATGYAAQDGFTQNQYSQAATDERTVKALLLNGAEKPAGWTHTSTQPLDTRYGAGLVNAYNAYELLAAGRQSYSQANNITTPATSSVEHQLVGWDFNSVNTASQGKSVNHYVFSLAPGHAYDLTSTLVWDAQTEFTSATKNQTPPPTYSPNYNEGLNNLFLKLYNANTGALVDSSVSTVDNVQ
ncbi:MAG: S8 family serine peptidase [Phycisphaerae bacterium]